MAKYLTKEQILNITGIIVIPDSFSLMSQDSYNEELIATKIAKSPLKSELLMSSLNIAIVGFGNRKYGNFKANNEIIQIDQIFTKANVKYNNSVNSNLKDDDLTPQRLCRFFRHSIRDYILTNKSQSYLWRKYSPRDPNFAHICFRGAEYLEDLTFDEANYLLLTVIEMDRKLNLNIHERIIRVFEAKGTKFKNIPNK